MLLEDKYAKSILRTLYENGAMTRKQILASLKMRLNALVDICNRLEEERFVLKEDSERMRNIPIFVNPRRFASMGVEHLRDSILCSLIDGQGRKVSSGSFPISPELGGSARMDAIVSLMKSYLDLLKDWDVVSLGFADIGIVDAEHGIGIFSAHVPHWENMPVGQILEREFRTMLSRVVDRSGASALDLLRSHPDNSTIRNSVQLYVGNGIGVTLLKDGRYWGEDLPSSCQIGHTIFQPDGERCQCGNRGCLETVAAVPALIRQAAKQSRGRIKTLEQFLNAAGNGDPICLDILMKAGHALGIATANIVTLTGVRNVMLRSVLCKASHVFFDVFQASLTRNVIYPFNREITASVNSQDADCTALGAAYFAQKIYFQS